MSGLVARHGAAGRRRGEAAARGGSPVRESAAAGAVGTGLNGHIREVQARAGEPGRDSESWIDIDINAYGEIVDVNRDRDRLRSLAIAIAR